MSKNFRANKPVEIQDGIPINFSSMPMHPKSFRVNKTVEMLDGMPINIFTLDVYYDFITVLLNVGIFEEYEDAYEFGRLLISKGHADLIKEPVFQLARCPYVKKEDEKSV